MADIYGAGVDIYKPELWAMESLEILKESSGLRNLVNNSFSKEIAEKGDTINTRFPDIFTAGDAGSAGEVTLMAVGATNVQIVLDQNKHVTFPLRDADAAKSLKDLRTEFMEPAVVGLMEATEMRGFLEMLPTIAQVTDYPSADATIITDTGFDETPGHVIEWGESLATGTAIDGPVAFNAMAIAAAAQAANEGKWPQAERHFCISPRQQYDLETDTGAGGTNLLLLKANEASDSSLLREAHLGRLFGFDVTMHTQLNSPSFLRADSAVDDTFPYLSTAKPALFFHKNAAAFVSRNMDAPPEGTGAKVASVASEGHALRVSIGYDILAKHLVVSLDNLFGWQVLRRDMGGVVWTHDATT